MYLDAWATRAAWAAWGLARFFFSARKGSSEKDAATTKTSSVAGQGSSRVDRIMLTTALFILSSCSPSLSSHSSTTQFLLPSITV